MIVFTKHPSLSSRLLPSSDARRLKGKTGEEPTRLASLESLLEKLLRLLLRRNLLGGVVQRVGRDDILEVDVERVTRRHEVRVVDVLDERLASRALGLLLFIHLLRHLCVFNRAWRCENSSVSFVFKLVAGSRQRSRAFTIGCNVLARRPERVANAFERSSRRGSIENNARDRNVPCAGSWTDRTRARARRDEPKTHRPHSSQSQPSYPHSGLEARQQPYRAAREYD